MPTNTSPQSVGRRYAHNLLVRGANQNFELDIMSQQIAASPLGLPVGFYYRAIVKRRVGFESYSGEGMTPVAALIAALTSAGVSFR